MAVYSTYGGLHQKSRTPRLLAEISDNTSTQIWGRLPKVGLGLVQVQTSVQSTVFRSQSNTIVSIFPHPSCPLVFFPSLPPRNLLDLHCSLVLVGQTNFHINGAHSQMRALEYDRETTAPKLAGDDCIVHSNDDEDGVDLFCSSEDRRMCLSGEIRWSRLDESQV